MIPQIHGGSDWTNEEILFPDKMVYYDGPFRIIQVLKERLNKIPGFERLEFKKYCQEQNTESETFLIRCCFDQTASDSGYELQIGKNCIQIRTKDANQVPYALTTLYWLIRENRGHLRCGKITDIPVYGYRGVMLDCSRHFFDINTVKSMIEQCALRKMNRIHLHLSDDQGYRIESRKFPMLNQTGSWRKEKDGKIYGGFYTWDQIRELVEYAYDRGVEIIPEIDMPGHVSAVLASYPELSCSGNPMDPPAAPGIYSRILCAGNDKVISFIKQLLDEIIDLFPSEYIHIGGDEAPKQEWEKCPLCQKRKRELRLDTEEDLQHWFTEEILRYLQQKGKTGICWNETLKSGELNQPSVIQYWDEEGENNDYCSCMIRNNQKCIYSYTPYLYLDYIPALTPLRKVFFDLPVTRGGRKLNDSQILGCEATLWSEQIPDQSRLEYMAFPRLFAVAERGWSGHSGYTEFRQRCEAELQRLDEDRIVHMTIEESDPVGEQQKNSVVKEYRRIISNAERDGLPNAQTILCGLVRSKLTGTFTDREIDGIIEKIKRK